MTTLCRKIATESKSMDAPVPADTWHVLSTAPGWERRVVDALRDKGFAPYLPQTTETTIRRGRKRTRQRLVMPSYVFVRLAAWANDWGCINRHDMEGVGRLVKNDDRPSLIPEKQMARVLAYVDVNEQLILDWLVKAGKISRISNRSKRRKAAQNRHLAKLAA